MNRCQSETVMSKSAQSDRSMAETKYIITRAEETKKIVFQQTSLIVEIHQRSVITIKTIKRVTDLLRNFP